jgi:ankyrin repeat protein
MSDSTDAKSFDEFQTHIKHGDILRVKALVAAGVGPDTRNRFGWTPLMLAASEGHTPIISYLISAGADVNAVNDFGVSPLAYAALEGHCKALDILLAAGANVHVQPHGVSLLEFTNRGGGRFRTQDHFTRLREAGAK